MVYEMDVWGKGNVSHKRETPCILTYSKPGIPAPGFQNTFSEPLPGPARFATFSHTWMAPVSPWGVIQDHDAGEVAVDHREVLDVAAQFQSAVLEGRASWASRGDLPPVTAARSRRRPWAANSHRGGYAVHLPSRPRGSHSRQLPQTQIPPGGLPPKPPLRSGGQPLTCL